MVDLKALLTPFARSIHAKATALRNLDLSPQHRARLREAISDDIKKCTNFIVPELSTAAAQKAAALGIDLRGKCWHDQHKFDAGRRIFHFEHILPVSAVRKACLATTSASGVLNVLRGKLRVVWILKKEDARLTKLGYRTKRHDPEAAYRKAKISLLPTKD
jgi:hypothetical protein